MTTHEVICVGAKKSVVIFPTYRRLDFTLRVFVEQDVKGDPRFHEGGLDPFGAIVNSEKRGENLGNIECQEKQEA